MTQLPFKFTVPAIAIGLLGVGVGGSWAAVVSIVSRAAYLHTRNDSAADAAPLALADFGLQEGDVIRLERLGDYDCGGPCVDDRTNMIAVFSASDVLLAPSLLNRVADAIDAGDDVVTANTHFGDQPTDIPEDFAIQSADCSSVEVLVPQGAAYLFIAPHDSLYSDNHDPDGDYAVRITMAFPGDFDGDETANLVDHAAFADCVTGPCGSVPCDPPLYGNTCCIAGDTDRDGDVDLVDIAALQLAFGE